MASAAKTTARDIQRITRANRDQSAAAARLATQIADIRRVADANVAHVQRTRGNTADLLKHTETLTALMNDPANASRPPRNGARGRAR
jgi:methyl-accepting chemotaxis protein